MACSTVSEDISGVLRGRCKDCECSGFTRTVELISHERVPLGWCILCGHSPVSHGVLTESIHAIRELNKKNQKTAVQKIG
ncbi:unnamed protein product, partial [Ixodes pacificus]